jgi:hypothetical protein
MTDWRRQSEEMMRTWTQMQREMWDGWTKAITKTTSTSPTQAWEQAMGAWQDAIQRTMTAQIEWAQLWADSMRTGMTMSREMNAWSEQMFNTMKAWTESQSKLWEGWMEMARSAAPDGIMKTFDENAQRAFKTWQDSVQKAIDAQQEFMRSWTAK